MRGELSHRSVIRILACALLFHSFLHRPGNLFIRPHHMFLLCWLLFFFNCLYETRPFLEQGLNVRRQRVHGVHNQSPGEQRHPFCFVLDRDRRICREPGEQWLFQGRAAAEEPAQGSLKGSPENNEASWRIAGPSSRFCSHWTSTKVGAALYTEKGSSLFMIVFIFELVCRGVRKYPSLNLVASLTLLHSRKCHLPKF